MELLIDKCVLANRHVIMDHNFCFRATTREGAVMSTKISEILDAIQERQERRKLTDIKQFSEVTDTQDIKKSDEDIIPKQDVLPSLTTSTKDIEQEVIGEDAQEEDDYEESLQKLQNMLQFKSPRYKSTSAEFEDEFQFKSPRYKSPSAAFEDEFQFKSPRYKPPAAEFEDELRSLRYKSPSAEFEDEYKSEDNKYEFEDEFDDEENINIRIQNIQNMLEQQTSADSIRKLNVFPVTVSSENFDNGMSSTWPLQCSKGEALLSNFASVEHVSTDLNANILVESDIKDNLSAAQNQNIDLYEILLEKLDNLLDEEGDMKINQQVPN